MKHGLVLFGICLGAESSVNGNFTNYRLGISCETRGQYGEAIFATVDVDLFEDDYIHIKNQAASLKGKDCYIPITKEAIATNKNGKTGFFMKIRAVRGARLSAYDPKLFQSPPVVGPGVQKVG